MRLWNSTKRLLAVLLVCALLLPNVLIPGVRAVDTNLTIPTTGISESRIVFVGTPSDPSKLPENTTPYATLEAALAALRAGSGDAVMIVSGTVTVTDSYNKTGTELTHGDDTYYITSKYLTYDFTSDAVINFTNTSSNIVFCFGGATHFSNVKLSITEGSKKVMFYAHLGMTIGENVVTSNANEMSIYAGSYLSEVASCDIVVSSGKWTTLMGGSDKYNITGKTTITVGGSAEITSNISTAFSKRVGSVEININGGKVNCIYSSPRADGVAGDVTYNLNAGQITSIADHSKAGTATVGNITVNLRPECDLGAVGTAWSTSGFAVGTKTLNLIGTFDSVSSALWNTMNSVNIAAGSHVTYGSTLGTAPAVTVAADATLLLTASEYADYTSPDGLPITNNGTVKFANSIISTVYVNNGVTSSGNGKTAGTAVKTLAEAYDLLDKVAGGTIVICGEVDATGLNQEASGITGTVVLTAKVSETEDYSATAKLKMSGTVCLSDSTEIADLAIQLTSSGTTTVALYSGLSLIVKETVTVSGNGTNGNFKLCCTKLSGTKDATVNVTVNGGTYHSIFMGGIEASTATGTVNLLIGGNTEVTSTLMTAPNKGSTQAANLTVNGEDVSIKVIVDQPGVNAATVGDVVVDLIAGKIVEMKGNTKTSTVASFTVKLHNGFDYGTSTFGSWNSASTVTGAKTLSLVGFNGTLREGVAANYTKLTVSERANVVYASTLPSGMTVTVEEGSVLTLKAYANAAAAAAAGVAVTGAGEVLYGDNEKVYASVVYVDGTGSGTKDGLSAANAVATLQDALALLNPAEGGTVVLCGEVVITSTTKLSDSGVTGQVTLTSVYGGVDYRESGARLTWGDDKVKIGASGNMVMDAMVLHTISSASNISQYLYTAQYLHLTESVTCTGTGYLKMFVANIGGGENMDCEALLEGGTFYQIFVGANENATGNATLTIDKNASVTSNVAMGGNTASNVVNGNAVLNMKGGYIKVIYDIANGGTVKGDVILNLLGGSITEMRDYNGKSGIAINGNVVVTVGSAFSAGSGSFGAWASSAVTVGGKKILNLVDYAGAGLNSLDIYDVVNVFGSSVPEGFDITPDSTSKLLRIHNYKGIVGLDLSTFTKIKVTGTDAYVTFQGKVPTTTTAGAMALIVDDGCTMLIRGSANPGVTLANYAITKLNNQTGEVIIGEAAYVGSADLVLDVDFEDGTASDASGNDNNGVITGSPEFVEGIDGGKAIYISNEHGKNKATQYVTFANLSGVDISQNNYTVSFWYHTINGGTGEWATSGQKSTAGADIDLSGAKVGGVVLSNQDTVDNGSGFSAVQLSHNQFFALGTTSTAGKHYDKDGIRTPVDDAWHMITITYDRNGDYTVYVDGQQEAVKSISALEGQTLGVNSLVLGADVNGKYGLGSAYIDNLRVFSGVMNPIDVQVYYSIDSTNMLINDAENSVEELGSAYESYKPGMTQTINTVKQAMEGVTPETYADAANAYTQLKDAYETFLAAPQEDALLSALLLSDIHISSVGDTNSQRLEMVFKDMSENGIQPDIFINGGDFSDNSSADAYNAAFNVYESLMEKYSLNMPMFLAQGNHEIAVESNGGYTTTTPIYDTRMLANLQSYIDSGKVEIDSENFDRTLGSNEWEYKVSYGYKNGNGQVVTHNANRGYSYGMTFNTEDGNSYHIVILNTDHIEQTGRSKDYTNSDGSYSASGNYVEPFRHGSKFLDDTLTWLDGLMASYAEDGLPIFVLNHAPFRDTCAMSTYSTTVIDDNTIGMQDLQVRAILAKYDNVFTFSGHLHHALGIASVLPVEDADTGNTFTQVNLPGIKGAARAYSNIPASWLMYVYEDEVVFRARDFSTSQWLPEYDVVVKLTSEPEEEKPVLGDADGDGNVDAFDAATIIKYSVGEIDGDGLNLNTLDVDGDGHVDAYDASLIQKFTIGVISKFPVEDKE